MAWAAPVDKKYFKVNNGFLAYNPTLYPKTKHHPGVDYPTLGDTRAAVYACGDGLVIFTCSQYDSSRVSMYANFLGNCVAIYIPSAGFSFLYCHLSDFGFAGMLIHDKFQRECR